MIHLHSPKSVDYQHIELQPTAIFQKKDLDKPLHINQSKQQNFRNHKNSYNLQHPKLNFRDLPTVNINLSISIACICLNWTPNIEMRADYFGRFLSLLLKFNSNIKGSNNETNLKSRITKCLKKTIFTFPQRPDTLSYQ